MTHILAHHAHHVVHVWWSCWLTLQFVLDPVHKTITEVWGWKSHCTFDHIAMRHGL